MKDMAFGLIMTLAGMGATFITLYILMLFIRLLNKFFPYTEQEAKDKSS